MALSLSGPRIADPDGGRYPPSRPVESGLSSVARPSNPEPPEPVSRPCSPSPGATAIIAPATNLTFHHTAEASKDNRPNSARCPARVSRPRRMPERRSATRATRRSTGAPNSCKVIQVLLTTT